MEFKEIQRIFEAFFEKLKKTEGDETMWSAFWAEHTKDGVVEIIMSKCPKGTSFKFFINKKKVEEVWGWENFTAGSAKVMAQYKEIYDEDLFFANMEQMI